MSGNQRRDDYGNQAGAMLAQPINKTATPSLQDRVNAAELHLEDVVKAKYRIRHALGRLRTPPPQSVHSGDVVGAGHAGSPAQVQLPLERRLELLDLAIKGEASELHELANAFDALV